MRSYLTPDDLKRGESNGIPENTVKYRFYTLGWSTYRATTQRYKKPKGLWPKYKETCAEHGISQTAFYTRINEYGMTPEQAATTPHMEKGTIKRSKIPKEIEEIAKKNGISKVTLKNRVYLLNWSIERASTEPTHTSKRRKDLETTRIRS